METMRRHKWIFKVIVVVSSLAIVAGAILPFVLQ